MSFNSFFREENYLFKTCNHVLDLVMLSVMWVFCSLPILTMGAATAALYFTVVKGMRAGETLPYGRFLRSFKENLKAGILPTLISAAAVAILGCGVYMLRQAALADSRYAVAYVAYYCACVLPVGAVCYLFPLLGRFDFKLRDLLRTALVLSIRHLPSTVVIVFVTIQAINFCLRYPAGMFLLPCLVILFDSLFLERIFKKYQPPQAPSPSDGSQQFP